MINKTARSVIRDRKHLRVRAKISGTSESPRLCVFRSNKHIEAQIIDDTKGITLVSVSSVSLHLENGSNIEAAQTVGAKIAELALAKGITTIVFDRGGYVYHGRVQALADAAREGGLKF